MKYFYDTRKDSYQLSEEMVGGFINVGFQVTRRCNLDCVYCSEAELMPDASLTEIKTMVNRLVKAGLKRICITGGEPLLREDLSKILHYIKSRGMTITLSTNGWLLNRRMLKEIMPYIDNIRFSIRGLEKSHDAIARVDGSFSKTIESIKLSKQLGLPVSVVFTVVGTSSKEMYDVAKLCEDLGVDKLYFFSLIPRGRATEIFKKQNVRIDKVTREFNRIMEKSRKYNWSIDIKVANFTLDGECVLVFPNGDVVGVPSFTDKGNQKILGNLLKNDLGEMWRNFPYKENYVNYYKNH